MVWIFVMNVVNFTCKALRLLLNFATDFARLACVPWLTPARSSVLSAYTGPRSVLSGTQLHLPLRQDQAWDPSTPSIPARRWNLRSRWL